MENVGPRRNRRQRKRSWPSACGAWLGIAELDRWTRQPGARLTDRGQVSNDLLLRPLADEKQGHVQVRFADLTQSTVSERLRPQA